MWAPKKDKERQGETRSFAALQDDKYREAVILSKAKNLKLSTFHFALSTLVALRAIINTATVGASLVGAQEEYRVQMP